VEVFAGDFTNRMTEGFKLGSPYSDVTNSPSELPTESPTEWVRRWFHWQKLIYHHSADPLLYFSFFFLIPTLLSQTANNQPPKKKSSSSQYKLYFFKFCGHNIHVQALYFIQQCIHGEPFFSFCMLPLARWTGTLNLLWSSLRYKNPNDPTTKTIRIYKIQDRTHPLIPVIDTVLAKCASSIPTRPDKHSEINSCRTRNT